MGKSYVIKQSVEVDLNPRDIFGWLGHDDLFDFICELEETVCDIDFTKRLRDRFIEIVSNEHLPLEVGGIIEMRLCETQFVVLKPDVRYVFTADPNCDECNAIAKAAPDYGRRGTRR